ncbi:probable glycosyltransferase STELLO1 isoform X1 [Haliotis rufescens]|uniref:probable glycosyltransferase STELLO1 isoform X1 n=2 Tax=Haliotis rufescens TaxID=6454 RepID=UPI00201FA4FA|nr:probable glycosyltransferase STELLO1 isoform X1 [Haliotis rufescens]
MFRPSDKKLFLCPLAIMVVLMVYQYRWQNSSWTYFGGDPMHLQSLPEYRNKRQHDKWLIASSFTGDDVIKIPGWRVLLLVNTSLSQSVCRRPWCITLSSTHPHLPADIVVDDLFHKKQAYLYAISNGAKHMCVIRHLNTCGLEMLKRMSDNIPQTGLVLMRNETVFDPHVLFKPPSNEAMSSLNEFYIDESVNPLVMSVFNPLLPEMNMGGQCKRPVYFESIKQHAPIFLQVNTFASLSSDVLAFHYDAFWALPLLDVDKGDFIIQRVLWYLNGRVGIYPFPVPSQSRIAHTTSSNCLVDFLHSWDCTGNLNVLECLAEVVKLLKDNQLLSSYEAFLVIEWLAQLRSIQYIIPKRIPQQRSLDLKKTTLGIIATPINSTSMTDTYHTRLRAVCPKTDIKFSDNTNDIALIISFNQPLLYANIPLLEAMYRPYFNNIIFCGPEIKNFTSYVQNATTGYFIYMELFKRDWHYMYECIIEAMKLNVDVKGFLQIGDDTLINPWNIDTLPRDKIWLHTGGRRENVSQKDINPMWIWWKDGKPRILAVIDDIRNMSLLNSTRSFANRFLHNYMNNSNNFTTLTIQGCDFMYVPASFKDNFTLVANLLLKHDVMVEIGFANVAYGLQMWKDIHFVKDGSLWHNREQYTKYYNTRDIFLHPFKLRYDLSEEVGRQFFCGTYLNASARVG